MADWTNNELEQALAEVARRSSVDLDFRTLALTDPLAALAKINSKPLPQDIKSIYFHDNSNGALHMSLPDPIPGIEELTEAELAAAAGAVTSIAADVGTGEAGIQAGWSR
jgi:hypothetical protein